MSVNLFEEKKSNQKFDVEENNSEKNNTILKVMKEFEYDNQIESTINDVIQNSTINNSTIMDINNKLNIIKNPYLYKDKIPEIIIKDENELVNKENIETYINSPFYPNLNDSIYNICENCKKRNNSYFCRECFKNICIICSIDCKKEHKHKLIKLIPNNIGFYKREIIRIIKEYFIEPKKKEENDEKDELIDKNKIISEPGHK